MNSLKENKTFSLVELPKGRKAISCRWVFDIKENGKYKARLVANGSTQLKGIDYENTFSPVLSFASMRTVFAIAAQYGMEVYRMDVTSAFLNGALKQEVYMKQPVGCSCADPQDKNKVLRLHKSIYALKQAHFVWYETFHKALTALGFERNWAEPCLYFKRVKGKLLLLALYVDVMIIAGSIDQIEVVKKQLMARFKMKDLKAAEKFLGINVKASRDHIKLSMTDYIENMVNTFGMSDCIPLRTPAVANQDLSVKPDEGNFCDETLYRRIVGKLLFAARVLRYDISFSVLKLARFYSQPREKHLKAAKRVLRYLAGTKDLGLYYRKNQTRKLAGYSDADIAKEKHGSQSTSANIFLYAGAPIVWRIKLQKTVATSTLDTELVALFDATREAKWLAKLFDDLQIEHGPILIRCGNQRVIDTLANGYFQDRAKHMRVKLDFTKEAVDYKEIDVRYIESTDNIAEMLTKALY